MGWRDRPYSSGGYSPYNDVGFSFGLPKPTPFVKYLLIINIGVFILQAIFRGTLEAGFALIAGPVGIVQFWRLVTYQFLHGDTFHLLFNMLGLYFFGPPIEQTFGSKRFLIFYFACGVVGGLIFILLGSSIAPGVYLIGASGSVLGLLSACAVMFPQMIIILLFFPVPIRIAALLLAGVYGLNVISTRNLSDACHFGGMLTGFLYTYYKPLFDRIVIKKKTISWEKQYQTQQKDQEELDKLLDKIHKKGIHSLTWYEKWKLKRITERQKRGKF